MKNLFILFTMLVSTTLSYSQSVVDDFIGKYENDDAFTSVFVSPKMFDMIGKVTDDQMEADLKDVIKDIKGLKVLRTETEPDKYFKEFSSSISGKNYDMLMKVREKDQNVKIFTQGSGDVVSELVILVGGENEFTLLSFIGNLNLDKLGKLAGKLNIEGAEHLKNLNKDNK